MATRICVVDNRVFLLGLDDLYRERMKMHERDELLRCARAACDALNVAPWIGPVEGYYSEDELLTEYFQRMRALQEARDDRRSLADGSAEFRRLLAVTSSRLYGEPIFNGNLLPSGNDPLSKALLASFPHWTVDGLISAAFSQVTASEDFSLVGLAALARDPVVLAALRETAVLYAYAVAGAALDRAEITYEWRVDPILAERATRFVSVFNELFDESLPAPSRENAGLFWCAADEAKIFGRCVRLGYDDSTEPVRNYHWAVTDGPVGFRVRDFWSGELWTTVRFREAVFGPGPLPLQT